MSEVGNPANTFVTSLKLLWTGTYWAFFTAPAGRKAARAKREPQLPDPSAAPLQSSVSNSNDGKS